MKIALKCLLALIVLCAFSCASVPPPVASTPDPLSQASIEPTATPVTPVASDSSSKENIADLAARAAATRKKAFDLGLFEIFPDDYRGADETYTAAKLAFDIKNEADARTGFDSSIVGFSDVISRGVLLLEQARRENADEIKQSALKAGAGELASSWLATGDEAYKSADALSRDGKHEDAIGGFTLAARLYELSQKRARASTIRSAISERNFASFDQGNFDLAETRYDESESLYESDSDAALDALDEAILRYNLVMQKGFELYAAERKEPADLEKARAEDLKANIAVKEDFAAALAVYEEAGSSMSQGSFEEAADLYAKAEQLFTQAITATAEKKTLADAALAELAAKAQESENLARQADAQLGAKP